MVLRRLALVAGSLGLLVGWWMTTIDVTAVADVSIFCGQSSQWDGDPRVEPRSHWADVLTDEQYAAYVKCDALLGANRTRARLLAAGGLGLLLLGMMLPGPARRVDSASRFRNAPNVVIRITLIVFLLIPWLFVWVFMPDLVDQIMGQLDRTQELMLRARRVTAVVVLVLAIAISIRPVARWGSWMLGLAAVVPAVVRIPGLLHALGLSGVLQALGLPSGQK